MRPAARDYLAVYEELTRLTSMVHDPQRVMELVVERLPALLGVDAATIRLLDTSSGTFVLKAAHGVSAEYLARRTIDSQEVLAALRRGAPMATTDLEQALDKESLTIIRREGIRSVMSVPILFKEQVFGMMRLLTRQTRDFGAEEIGFVMSLAAQVGIAIANSRMFQEMERQVHFLGALRDISVLVNSTLDLDTILTTVVGRLPEIMQVKGCTVRLLQPETNRLQLVAASGVSEAYLGRGAISGEDSIFRVLGGEPVAIYDATTDSRVDFHEEIRREGICSILAVPITSGKEVIGVLRLLTGEHRSFTASEIGFAVAVAAEAGNAIHKARTYRQITLLFNRIEEDERFLQTVMDALWMQLVAVSPDRRVILANRMFLGQLGLEEADVLGRDYHEVAPWPPSAGPCPLEQVLAGAGSVAVLDKMEGPDGCHWYERHLTPIHNGEGAIEFVIEVVRDITDQRLLEREKLERVKLEAIVEMAGTAAHELNTPLFAALGAAQLLQDEELSPSAMEDLAMIARNLKEMAALTAKMTAVTGFEKKQYVGGASIVSLQSRES